MLSLTIGLIAGSLCAISFLPQVIKIYRTKRVEDLSLVTFSVFSLGVFLWLIYGILIRELPVVLTNSLVLILSLLIIAMKIKYSRGN